MAINNLTAFNTARVLQQRRFWDEKLQQAHDMGMVYGNLGILRELGDVKRQSIGLASLQPDDRNGMNTTYIKRWWPCDSLRYPIMKISPQRRWSYLLQ
jgi:hypothetical protein